jgi:uncharacterized protein
VKREAAFWDANALVPLFVPEAASRMARQWARRYEVVAWWGSRVEIHSAICRLFRSNAIDNKEREGAVARLKIVRETWREILPADELRDSAERLMDKHPLRSADSMQLAAALAWCGGRPAKRSFLCADERLMRAAQTEGFSVIAWPKMAYAGKE